MRLGSKTEEEFLIKLNEKNIQIQNIFHGKVKEVAKKYQIDVMMQDGTVKKQETIDVEKSEIANMKVNLIQNNLVLKGLYSIELAASLYKKF